MSAKKTLEEMIPLLKKMAQPIDFAELERQGAVSKVRGTWYRIHNLNALPEHWGYMVPRIC